MGKLTEAQRNALKVLWGQPGSTTSTDLKERTLKPLVRKGLLSSFTVKGIAPPYIIYDITDAGRAALEGET